MKYNPFDEANASGQQNVYTVRNAIDNKLVSSVDPSQLKPINDHNHEHQFVPDPSDETDDYYAVICQVPRCNLGQLIAKHDI